MQSLTRSITSWGAVSIIFLSGAVSLSEQVYANSTVAPQAKFSVSRTVTAAAAVAALKPAAAPVLKLESVPQVATKSEKDLRAVLKFDTVRWAGKPVQTLDESSRILLAKAAAEKVGLREVGLSFQDVYGVIEAETSWIPRTGSSKDGTPNLGLAQFEPRTARGLGVTDPSDPVQAVIGAAMYMKEGARWASKKVAALNLPPEQHAQKVREGVSVYYNLSIKGRNKWDGLNADQLPVETQRHIQNARMGAAEAAQLARQLKV